jgi:hypothetical protein
VWKWSRDTQHAEVILRDSALRRDSRTFVSGLLYTPEDSPPSPQMFLFKWVIHMNAHYI